MPSRGYPNSTDDAPRPVHESLSAPLFSFRAAEKLRFEGTNPTDEGGFDRAHQDRLRVREKQFTNAHSSGGSLVCRGRIYATRPFCLPTTGRIYAAPTLPSARRNPIAVIPILRGLFQQPPQSRLTFYTMLTRLLRMRRGLATCVCSLWPLHPQNLANLLHPFNKQVLTPFLLRSTPPRISPYALLAAERRSTISR